VQTAEGIRCALLATLLIFLWGMIWYVTVNLKIDLEPFLNLTESQVAQL
jgi:hypothetical protein